MHDPDFEPAGVIYASVRRSISASSPGRAAPSSAETIAAALAVVDEEPVSAGIASRDEVRWVGGLVRRSGQPPEVVAHIARRWRDNPDDPFVAETIGGMQTRVNDLLLTLRQAARQQEIYEAEPMMRLCSAPGCWERATTSGRCAQHASALSRQRDPRTPGQKGYGSKHQRMARRVLREESVCHLCGGPAREGDPLEVDHILPLSMGGSGDRENLAAAHMRCNRGEGRSQPAGGSGPRIGLGSGMGPAHEDMSMKDVRLELHTGRDPIRGATP